MVLAIGVDVAVWSAYRGGGKHRVVTTVVVARRSLAGRVRGFALGIWDAVVGLLPQHHRLARRSRIRIYPLWVCASVPMAAPRSISMLGAMRGTREEEGHEPTQDQHER